MKRLLQKIIIVLLFGIAVVPAKASFTSLYVFGDALSSTTDNQDPSYYAHRYSNGRVWVEVLAQRQGLVYDATKNDSSYDHNSTLTLQDVNNFNAPPDVSTALFVLWVCNADTFDSASDFTTGSSNSIFAQWQAANTLSQANHLQIITNLYAKGVRNLIMPNAVDISTIPAFNAGSFVGVMHNGCLDYNAKFANTINQARTNCPGLNIYTPDYFTLLNNVFKNAASYGLTNALYNGLPIDAVSLHSLNKNFPPAVTNGFGANFIFWDNQDPTAQLHEIMADVAQQIISPVQIGKLAVFNGSNRLDVVNVPLGLNGFVDGSTNLASANWTSVTNFNSASLAQSIFVNADPLPVTSPPSSGGSGGGSIDPNNPGNGSTNSVALGSAAQFYRLRLPYSWTWP